MTPTRTPIAELYRSRHPTSPTPSSSSPHSHATRRTSVSIQPDEDPFSPFTIPTTEPNLEEDDEWTRVSEDSIGLPEREGGGEGEEGQESTRTIRRTPSFLKTLWDKRSSRSSSVSSLRSLKKRISNPILKTDPPRVGPLRSRASLVSFGDTTRTFSPPNSVREEEDDAGDLSETPEGTILSDRLSPPPTASYPSGSQSLGIRRSRQRASILGHTQLSQTIGPSGPRTPQPSRTLTRSYPFDVGELPPTDSPKAFAILVGPRVTEKNKKAVERLTGFRSDRPAGEPLGIAVSPEIAIMDKRIPLASVPSEDSLPRQISPPAPHENIAIRRSLSGYVRNASSPLRPPPSIPLPPLPDEAARPRRQSAIRFVQDAKETTEVAPPEKGRLSSKRLSSRASEPDLRKPIASLFSRKPRPASTDASDSSLHRFRSHEALRPVSSAALPRVVPTSSSLPKPVASLYLVAGLNKNPSRWSPAMPDPMETSATMNACTVNAVPRLWRPEVLDRKVSAGDVVKLTKEEISKVQAKAIKLAFHRDVKIIASSTQPSATTSFFSFPISSPTSSTRSSLLSGPIVAPTVSPLAQTSTVHHVVTLTVWSRANDARSQAIRSLLTKQSKGDEIEAKRARAAARNMTRQLQNEMRGTASRREEWEDVNRDFREDTSTVFWLPYTLILVSASPLYSLLGDVLRLSVSEAQGDIQFVATVPGDFDWSVPNFPTWPFFKALHADNILSIVELALAPQGRVLFVSRHSIMLSIATCTLQLIIERRGWNGLIHPRIHLRDLRIYLEDPGPWIVATESASRPLALRDLPPEIVEVDLDTNTVTCSSPSALSKGGFRDRARRRLQLAVGNPDDHFAVPLSIVEAFPFGKFRPFSEVEVEGKRVVPDRLAPEPSWNWDEETVLGELESILADLSKRGAINRIMRPGKARRTATINRESTHLRAVTRKRADSFVEHRDALEARLSKLDHRATLLLNESKEWQESFAIFRAFSDGLAQEAQELEIQIETEQRESARLLEILEDERAYGQQLAGGLEAIESSRDYALSELISAQAARRTLEVQSSIILDEVQNILEATEQSHPLFQEALASARSSPDSPTSQSARSTQLAHRDSSITLGSVPEEIETADGDTRHADESKAIVVETLALIASRLSAALEEASQQGLNMDERKADITPPLDITLTNPSTPPSPEEDRTIVLDKSWSSGSITACASSYAQLASSATLTFQPKPLTLTPPVSPENCPSQHSPTYSFVTPRTNHRRTVSKQHSLSRQSSYESPIDNARVARSRQQKFLDSSPTLGGRSSGAQSITSATLLSPHSIVDLDHGTEVSLASETLSDSDDAGSFVSVEEGPGGDETLSFDPQVSSSSSRLLEADVSVEGPEEPRQPNFDQQEVSANREQEREGDMSPDLPDSGTVSPLVSPEQTRRGHTRQDSFGLDAPPVELFTRSGSVRRRNEASRQGSIDLSRRMRPSQVKGEGGKWEPAPSKPPLSSITNQHQ
ncbi:hypothetical protein JCM16303_001947 [Sporobolomyces ruberrimus]